MALFEIEIKNNFFYGLSSKIPPTEAIFIFFGQKKSNNYCCLVPHCPPPQAPGGLRDVGGLLEGPPARARVPGPQGRLRSPLLVSSLRICLNSPPNICFIISKVFAFFSDFKDVYVLPGGRDSSEGSSSSLQRSSHLQ